MNMDTLNFIMLVAFVTAFILFFCLMWLDFNMANETTKKIVKGLILIAVLVFASGLIKVTYDRMTEPTIYVTPSGQFINADSLKQMKPVVK